MPLTSPHSEVTLPFGAPKTLSEPLNHIPQGASLSLAPLPKLPGTPQEGTPMGLSVDNAAQEPCWSLAIL